MPTDSELLEHYVSNRDEDAFAQLVQRHLNLVYNSALRRTGGRHALAEEIAQKVFTYLAQQAAQLTRHPTLTGWLYRTTRNVAIDLLRAEHTREKLAQTLTTMPDTFSCGDHTPDWEQLRPVIDGAMDQLKSVDREILLLRFFQNLTFGEVGAKLNLSENTARMRTTRALDKLRLQLRSRGVTSTASLATLLTAQALVGAPSHLSARITQAALAAPQSGSVASFFASALHSHWVVACISATVTITGTSLAWDLVDRKANREVEALRSENVLGSKRAEITPRMPTETLEGSLSPAKVVEAVSTELAGRNASSPAQHRYQGLATAYDAFLSFGWALETADAAALKSIIIFDEKGQTAIEVLHAKLPDDVRALFSTPEDFVIFLYLADMLINPLPEREVAEKYVVTETRPGEAFVSREGFKPRPDGLGRGVRFVHTSNGWRCVVPPGFPEHLAKRILNNPLFAKLGGT